MSEERKKIIVKKMGLYWKASVEGDEKVFHVGDSPKEAILNLIIDYSNYFGIELKIEEEIK